MLAPALAVLSAAIVAAADPTLENQAQEGSVDGKAAASIAPGHPPDWFLLPVAFWLPETKLGFGAAGGLHFLLEGSTRASNVFAVAAYTLEKQGSIDVASDLYLRSGTLVTAKLRAVHYPDAFYGVGARTPEEARDAYTRRFVEAAASLELPALGGRLRVGPRVAARAEEIRDVRPGGLLDTSGLPGLRGFAALGVGGSVTWDTRDRPLWPGRGQFAQAYYVRYPEALGDGGAFGKAALDLRSFHPLGREQILAFGLVVENADGDVPFTLLSRIGNARFLRGYREGRYRDRLAWAAQTELRVPLASRVWGTAFAAAGDVERNLSLRLDTIKAAGGLGLRFRLTGEGANLRLDVAASEAGPEVYVVLLEAF